MTLPNTHDSLRSADRETVTREIVIVDPKCDRYGDFVSAAMDGEIGLHFCCDAQSAIKLARRFRADVWLVAEQLPDMGGFDLLPLLTEQVSQGAVDPLLQGRRQSLGSVGQGRHAGIFIIADDYSIEGEQHALAAGSAGYLVQPVATELVAALNPRPTVVETAAA